MITTQKQNCWEFKSCGRKPGGVKAAKFGICPASTNVKVNGTNSGKNGGRACWPITLTFCGGVVQGSFATLTNCMSCDFYKLVELEEGVNHESSKDILARGVKTRTLVTYVTSKHWARYICLHPYPYQWKWG